MSYQIFVSYRRDGGEALACLISERLKQQGFETFYDVDSLRSGKFNEAIFSVIDECTDVVVVLPPNGLDRCKNDDDWVRKEISYSIQRHKNIIPIMMRNFEFPKELPKDIEELRNFNGISANMEYFDASFSKLLAMLQSNKFLKVEKLVQLINDEELKKELIRCAEEISVNNNALTKYNMANCYSKLKNDSLNEEIAKLYTQAANLGFAPAQNKLGDCYYYGNGVEKNVEKAFYWYNMSAIQGDTDAQYNLAHCFANYHSRLAFVWMKKVADQNIAKAFYYMGEFYEFGYGTKKDYHIARNYYQKAVEMGCECAVKKATGKYWKLKNIVDFFNGKQISTIRIRVKK